MPDIIKFLDDFKDEALIPALGTIKEAARRVKEGVTHPVYHVKRGTGIITEGLVKPVLGGAQEKILTPAVEYLTKVEDIAEGRVKGDQGEDLLVEDLPVAQQAAGGMFQTFKNVGLGVFGTMEGMARGFEWLGVDKAKPIGDKLAEWQGIAATEDPDFADKLTMGLGSATTFFIPGAGIAKGVGFFSRFSPRVAAIFGSTMSTALESITEAGDSWQEAKDMGASEEEADSRATKVFWANAVLIGITNKLGMFNQDLGKLKKVLMSSPLEGLQEFGQQVISNTTAGRQWDEGAYEAGGIGLILGGLLGTSDFGTKMPTPQEMEKKKKEIMKETGLNSEDAQALMNYTTELMANEEAKDKPDIVNKAIDLAKAENGQVPNIVNEAVMEAGVGIEVKPEALQIEQPEPTEIYSITTKAGETIFTNNARLAQQSDPNFVTINTSDLNLRTFRSEEEIRAYVQAQEATTLDEALKNEGKFDAYAIVDSATENIAYGVVEAEKLTETLREQQFITTKEAIEEYRSFKYVQELKLPIRIQKRMLTPKGKDVLGKYSNTITSFIENPAASTPSHEAVHSYLDLLVDAKKKQGILDEVKRRYAGKKLDNFAAEEQLANDFIKYIKAKQNNVKAKAASTKLQRLFDWMLESFKKISTGKDKIEAFYKEVLEKKPTAKQKIEVAARMERAMADIESVQKEYYQEPQKLTTKFLEHPEVKNRKTASYQFLKNLLKSKSLPLKGAERSMIEDVLETQFKDEKKINMDDFVGAVQSELLPLDPIFSEQFADYGLDNIDRDVAGEEGDASTYILNSPFKHGKSGHFSGEFSGEKPGLFSHFRSYDLLNEGAYITEIQSDVFQGGAPTTLQNIRDREKEVKKIKEDIDDFGLVAQKESNQNLLKQKLKTIEGLKTEIKEGEKAFDSYRNTWYERTIRESIRIKAMENVGKVFFPTPYTVANIEGYINSGGQIPTDTREGEEFDYAGMDYTLLEKQYGAESGLATPTDNIRTIIDFNSVRLEDVEEYNRRLTDESEDMEHEIKEYSEYDSVEEFQTAAEKDESIIEEIAEALVDRDYMNAEGYVDYWNENNGEVYNFTDGERIFFLQEAGQTETLMIGEVNYETNEELDSTHKTVLRFYDKQVYKYLKKFRKKNLELIEDENGFEWWMTKITPEDKSAVEAFQTKESLETELVSGEEVASYFRKIDKEDTGEVDEDLAKTIEGQSYRLQRVKINEVLDQEENLPFYNAANYVDDGVNRKDTTDEVSDTVHNPIIIGNFDDLTRGVLDGYNRLLTKLNNDEQTIEAYVSETPKYQTISDLSKEERVSLEIRRGKLRDELTTTEIEKENEILYAREYFPKFFEEKLEGYENFKRLAARRKWVLDNATDEATVKDKVKNIDIDNYLFTGATDVSNDQLLDMFREEYFAEQAQKELAKQKTPSEILEAGKRLATKAVKKETIGRRPSIKQAINAATGNVKPEEVTTTKKQVIRERLLAMAKGSKIGRAEMKATMNEAFKTTYNEIANIKKAIIEYAKPLPANEKGKLLNLVAKANNKKDLVKAYIRIDTRLELSDRREALEQLKQTTKTVMLAKRTGKNIALDYQRKIMEILNSYSLKKPMKKTIGKLKELKKFIDKNPELKIPKHLTKKLEVLGKKHVTDITTARDIRELNHTITQLVALGHLKLNLKNKYDERQRQISLEKLIGSTRNMEKVKRGYMNTIHAFRVTDIMDGSQDYRGQNTRYQQKISRKVGNAELTSNSLLEDVFDKIKGVKTKWTEEEQAIMEVHMLMDMEANTQAQQLISNRGWKKLPNLTEEMKVTIDLMRGTFDKYVDNIAAVYEEHNNKEFERVDNYFPLKYEKKKGALPEPTIGQQIARSKRTEQGFTFGRQKGVKRVPRVDVFAQFEEAIREQQYYLNVQPTLIEVSSLISDEAYMEVAGDKAVNWWADYIDAVSNKGRLSRSTHNAWLARKRINLSRAILGYKLSSVLMQPMAIFDAMAYTYGRFGAVATSRLLTHFAGAFLDPTYTGRVKRQSPALQLRDGGELAIEEIEGAKVREGMNKIGLIDKYQRNSLKPLQWLDLKTASAVAQSTYRTLKATGLSDAEARLESDLIMNITAGSSEIADRPMILMMGEELRTLFTFQTFLLNRWGIISHDLIGAGIKDGNITRKGRALIGLMILAMGGGFEDEVRGKLFELVSGKKLKGEKNFIKSALMTIPESVPILGQILRSKLSYGQSFSVPLTRTIENVVTGFQMLSSDKKSTQERGMLKISESLATYFGVAGTAQLSDLIERQMINESKQMKQMETNINLMPSIPSISIPSIPSIPTF